MLTFCYFNLEKIRDFLEDLEHRRRHALGISKKIEQIKNKNQEQESQNYRRSQCLSTNTNVKNACCGLN